MTQAGSQLRQPSQRVINTMSAVSSAPWASISHCLRPRGTDGGPGRDLSGRASRTPPSGQADLQGQESSVREILWPPAPRALLPAAMPTWPRGSPKCQASAKPTVLPRRVLLHSLGSVPASWAQGCTMSMHPAAQVCGAWEA